MPGERAGRHAVEVDGNVVARRCTTVEDDRLVIVFDISGPHASPEFATDHVVLLRPGDTEKLKSLGGWGGYEQDGSAFFEWRFEWPGGDEVEVLYFAEGDDIVDREFVPLSERHDGCGPLVRGAHVSRRGAFLSFEVGGQPSRNSSDRMLRCPAL